MDKLVFQIQGHTSQNDWASVATHFRQQRKDLANVRENDIIQALGNINPSVHPVGYGCILSLVADDVFKFNGDLVNLARRWMLESDQAAMRHIPSEAAIVCRGLAASAEQNQAASLQALYPLRTMIHKCQPSSEHMTPAHAAALKAALCAKKYYTGHQIIAQPLYVLNKADTGLTATDFLLYCYYGGLISIGCKDYAKASELLLLAVTTPTGVPDAIICAAWKMYLLIHALRTGEVAEPPKHTSYVTSRQLREIPRIYAYVRAYSTSNIAAMQSILDNEALELREDGVYGLAHQLFDKLATRSIQRLTSTYLTLSLADIAKEAAMENADKAELHILKMIDAGEVHAGIDEEAGMVRFQETQDDATPAVLAVLNEKMGEMIAMQQRLQAVSRDVGLEPHYLQSIMQGDKPLGKTRAAASLYGSQAGHNLNVGSYGGAGGASVGAGSPSVPYSFGD